jgi:hypothetical protein
MPRHNPDVIAALAEGRLDPEEAAAMEREISSDPVASAELAAHRIALTAVADAPKAEMSLAEKSELRAGVAEALGITAAEQVVDEPAARKVPWASLGIAAATLAGLMAIVPVAGLLSTGGADDSASLELGALAPTSTEAAAADAEMRAATATDESAVASEADLDDALMLGESESDGAAFGSSTTVPRTTTAAAAAPAATTTLATTTTATAPESSTTSSTSSEAVEQLTAELEAIKSDPDSVIADLADEALEEDACYLQDTGLRLPPPATRYTFEHQNGDLTVIVYFELVGVEFGPFQVWGLPGCDPLAVIP